MGEFRFIFRIGAGFALLPLCLLTGCGSMRYLLQAAHGQFALLNHARPIAEVIADEKTHPRVKALLKQIEPIKAFGEQNGLKPTRNYRTYVQLDRPAAVWVVSACEKLRFKSKQWSFPLVGSFPYLGWFDLKAAEEYRDELKREGWDVHLRGAGAYSTLGWFPDAVLSSMLPEGDETLGDLVNVVLHESVHATLYVNGQSFFNESLASFVADGLTRAYLARGYGSDSRELKTYIENEKKSERFQQKLHEAYLELDQIYRQNDDRRNDHQMDDRKKLEQKETILNRLKAELQFKREINNATLIQYQTYNTGQFEFEQVLKRCDSNWSRLINYLKTIRPESFSQTQQNDLSSTLRPWIQGNCL